MGHIREGGGKVSKRVLFAHRSTGRPVGKRPLQNQDTEAANHPAITLHKKGPFLLDADRDVE
jgi:hypothetical protein